MWLRFSYARQRHDLVHDLMGGSSVLVKTRQVYMHNLLLITVQCAQLKMRLSYKLWVAQKIISIIYNKNSHALL